MHEIVCMKKSIQAVLISILTLCFFITHPSPAAEKSDETSSAPYYKYSSYSYQRGGESTPNEYLYLNDSGSLQKKVPGVGSGLANMLDGLIAITGSSENKFKKIVEYFPSLMPDLYRVFITL